MNKLFILSGASGVGKSTLLNRLVLDNFCGAANKYSERKRFNTLDDVIAVDDITDPNLECDLIYTMYGNKYGFSSKKIQEELEIGNQILIANDVNTIDKIKTLFPNNVIVIYIVSDINVNVLRLIYMKRHGLPSMRTIESNILERLEKCREELLQDNIEEFINYHNEVNEIINSKFYEDEEFKLRAESLKHRAKIYLNDFIYDYIVFNFYSRNKNMIEATENAYEQLKKIVVKESEGNYGEYSK